MLLMRATILLLSFMLVSGVMAQVPVITSYNNSVAGSDLYKVINTGTPVEFNVVSYTGNITAFVWSLDGSSVGGSGSSYNTTLNYQSGSNLRYIRVYGSGPNGSSNTIEWRISVMKAFAAAPISTVNQSAYESTYASVEAFDPVGFLSNVMTQYTGSMGNYVYLFIWVIIFVMIWMRQGSITVPSALGLLFGVVIIAMLPEQYQIVAQFMIAMGGIAVLYVLFSER